MAACFATMDTSNKYIGAFVPVLLVIWVRYLFQCVVMAVWLLGRHGLRAAAFRTAHPKFQATRGERVAEHAPGPDAHAGRGEPGRPTALA